MLKCSFLKKKILSVPVLISGGNTNVGNGQMLIPQCLSNCMPSLMAVGHDLSEMQQNARTDTTNRKSLAQLQIRVHIDRFFLFLHENMLRVFIGSALVRLF